MILAYHEIAPGEQPYLYSATCEQFESHIRFASEHKAAVQITFDDGHASQHRHALPIMDRWGCRGLFFITGSWVDVRPTHMTASQLRDLTAHGHEIQSHGWSHRFLTTLSDGELADDLSRSKQYLENIVTSAVDAISMPGGRCNNRVLRACAAAGYKRVFVSHPWIDEQTATVSVRGRLMVRKTTTVDALQRMYSAPATTAVMQRVRIRTIAAVRGLIGDATYHRIWCRLADWRE
jgi:peptidoglycan/xylan/chitin deacetylase (PgdA/CDA1 family)